LNGEWLRARSGRMDKEPKTEQGTGGNQKCPVKVRLDLAYHHVPFLSE